MKNYKVRLFDLDTSRMRTYFVSAKDTSEIISRFDHIFSNNPSYILSSVVELVVDEIPRFEYFIQY